MHEYRKEVSLGSGKSLGLLAILIKMDEIVNDINTNNKYPNSLFYSSIVYSC